MAKLKPWEAAAAASGSAPDTARPKPWEAAAANAGPSLAQYLDDAIASLVTGVNKGVAGTPGLLGDIGDGQDWLLRKAGVPEDRTTLRNILSPLRMLPDSSQTIAAWENATGKLPEPKYMPGKVAETVGTFLVPTPGSKLQKGATWAENVAEGGADILKAVGAGGASEAAGQATEGTWLEPIARFVAALGGGAAGHYASLPNVDDMGRMATQRMKSVVPDLDRPGRGGTRTGNPANRLNDLTGPAMLLDASPATTRVASGLATRGGPAMDTIVNATGARQAGTSDRLVADAMDLFGPAKSTKRLEDAIENDVRASADPLYRRGYTSGVDLRGYAPVISDLFDQAAAKTGSQAAQKAIGRYGSQVADILKGKDPELVIRRLHDLRQEMDKTANWNAHTSTFAAPPSHVQQAARETRSIIDDVLKTEVPQFADADAIVEVGKTRQAATEYGKKVLGGGQDAIWPEDLSRDLARSRPPSKSAAGRQTRIPEFPRKDVKAAVRADIETSMGTQANDLGALSKKMGGDNDFNRKKLANLFGETPTDAVVKRIEDERLYSQNNSDIWRGSQTAGRSEAARFLDPKVAEMLPPNLTGWGLAANVGARLADRFMLPQSSLPKVARTLTKQGADARKVAKQLQDATGFRLIDYLMTTAAKANISGRR